MKKIMMAAVALICMTLAGVSFASCGSDDDPTPSSPTTYVYLVTGNLGYQVQDAGEVAGLDPLWQPMQDYTNAIKEVSYEPYYEEKDDAVKNACDAVYKKHMEMKGVRFIGKVEVKKAVKNEDKGVIWSKNYD